MKQQAGKRIRKKLRALWIVHGAFCRGGQCPAPATERKQLTLSPFREELHRYSSKYFEAR